jgi:hypothetical protein
MGESVDEAGYVQPSPGDVWDFLGEAKQWLSNIHRKGIPVS